MPRKYLTVALAGLATLFLLRPPAVSQSKAIFYSRLNDPPSVYTIIHKGVSSVSNGTPFFVRVSFKHWGTGFKVTQDSQALPANQVAFFTPAGSAPRSPGSSGGSGLPDPDEHVFPDPWPTMDDLPDPDPWPEIPEPPLDDWDPDLDLPGMDFPDPSDDTWFPTDLSDNDLTPWHFTPGSSSSGAPEPNPGNIAAAPRIATGTKPAGIAITDDGKLMVLANNGSSNLTLMAPGASPTVLATIALPAESRPFGVAVSHDGTRAYVTSFVTDNAQVYIVDLPNRRYLTSVAVGNLPVAIAVTPDDAQFWVSATFDSSIWIFDRLTNTLVTRIVPLQNPWGIAFNATGTRAYVASANGAGGTINVIDATTYRVITSIGVGNQPRQVVVTPSGRHVFCNNRFSGTVSQIDTATNTVIRTFNVGEDPEGVQLGK
jgi:YVTN family beta-propeller protein